MYAAVQKLWTVYVQEKHEQELAGQSFTLLDVVFRQSLFLCTVLSLIYRIFLFIRAQF